MTYDADLSFCGKAPGDELHRIPDDSDAAIKAWFSSLEVVKPNGDHEPLGAPAGESVDNPRLASTPLGSGQRAPHRDRGVLLTNRMRLLSRTLTARPEPKPKVESRIPTRAGAVQATVIQALAGADRSLRAREIHEIGENLAGTALSWNTVKDCLHKHAHRPDSPIERVSHGRYRHR